MLGQFVAITLFSMLVIAHGFAQAEPPKPKDGPLGMKFVPLPKGSFFMGWSGEKSEVKKTEINADFEIATQLVTQGQWLEMMGKNDTPRGTPMIFVVILRGFAS